MCQSCDNTGVIYQQSNYWVLTSHCPDCPEEERKERQKQRAEQREKLLEKLQKVR